MIKMMDEMIRPEDEYVYGDSGYRGIEKRKRHKNVEFRISMMRGKRRRIKGTAMDIV